jgi:hypothetical protein
MAQTPAAPTSIDPSTVAIITPKGSNKVFSAVVESEADGVKKKQYTVKVKGKRDYVGCIEEISPNGVTTQYFLNAKGEKQGDLTKWKKVQARDVDDKTKVGGEVVIEKTSYAHNKKNGLSTIYKINRKTGKANKVEENKWKDNKRVKEAAKPVVKNPVAAAKPAKAVEPVAPLPAEPIVAAASSVLPAAEATPAAPAATVAAASAPVEPAPAVEAPPAPQPASEQAPIPQPYDTNIVAIGVLYEDMPDGGKRTKYITKSGFSEYVGVVEETSKDGVLMTQYHTRNNRKEGLERKFKKIQSADLEAGNVEHLDKMVVVEENTYDADKIVLAKEFFIHKKKGTSIPKSEIAYNKNGQKHSTEKKYEIIQSGTAASNKGKVGDSALVESIDWVNGAEHGLHIVKRINQNLALLLPVSETPMKNDMKDGPEKIWSQDIKSDQDSPETLTTYAGGIPNGPFVRYDSKGQVLEKYINLDGRKLTGRRKFGIFLGNVLDRTREGISNVAKKIKNRNVKKDPNSKSEPLLSRWFMPDDWLSKEMLDRRRKRELEELNHRNNKAILEGHIRTNGAKADIAEAQAAHAWQTATGNGTAKPARSKWRPGGKLKKLGIVVFGFGALGWGIGQLLDWKYNLKPHAKLEIKNNPTGTPDVLTFTDNSTIRGQNAPQAAVIGQLVDERPENVSPMRVLVIDPNFSDSDVEVRTLRNVLQEENQDFFSNMTDLVYEVTASPFVDGWGGTDSPSRKSAVELSTTAEVDDVMYFVIDNGVDVSKFVTNFNGLGGELYQTLTPEQRGLTPGSESTTTATVTSQFSTTTTDMTVPVAVSDSTASDTLKAKGAKNAIR